MLVHTQCERRGNSMNAVEAPCECNENANTRQLERRRNAMELRRNANVVVRSPWKRHLTTPCSHSGKATRCDRDLIKRVISGGLE